MEPTPMRSETIRAGLETYALETALGAQADQAAVAAITASVRAHETAVLHRICRAAELVSASLLAEPGGQYSSHAAAITWFVASHIVALPALADADCYHPAPGDIIEVTLTGSRARRRQRRHVEAGRRQHRPLVPVRGAGHERRPQHARPGHGGGTPTFCRSGSARFR